MLLFQMGLIFCLHNKGGGGGGGVEKMCIVNVLAKKKKNQNSIFMKTYATTQVPPLILRPLIPYDMFL
jgi:hypothetical protein